MSPLDALIFGPRPTDRCDHFRVGGADRRSHPVGGLWRMWYFCRDHAVDPAAPPTLGIGRVALAISRNRIHRERVNGPLTTGAVLEPSAVSADLDSLTLGVIDVTRGAGGRLIWTWDDRKVGASMAPGIGMHAGLGTRPVRPVAAAAFRFSSISKRPPCGYNRCGTRRLRWHAGQSSHYSSGNGQ
jgi:hypothetical protein